MKSGISEQGFADIERLQALKVSLMVLENCPKPIDLEMKNEFFELINKTRKLKLKQWDKSNMYLNGEETN